MNRALLMILAPATLVALVYWGLGYRPPLRASIGVLLFLIAFAWIMYRKGISTPGR